MMPVSSAIFPTGSSGRQLMLGQQHLALLVGNETEIHQNLIDATQGHEKNRGMRGKAELPKLVVEA